jgi:hypothetical protein
MMGLPVLVPDSAWLGFRFVPLSSLMIDICLMQGLMSIMLRFGEDVRAFTQLFELVRMARFSSHQETCTKHFWASSSSPKRLQKVAKGPKSPRITPKVASCCFFKK